MDYLITSKNDLQQKKRNPLFAEFALFLSLENEGISILLNSLKTPKTLSIKRPPPNKHSKNYFYRILCNGHYFHDRNR